jgi:hypothetical protein
MWTSYHAVIASQLSVASNRRQFIDNPAYNTDKGPVNLFAGRFGWQF